MTQSGSLSVDKELILFTYSRLEINYTNNNTFGEKGAEEDSEAWKPEDEENDKLGGLLLKLFT